VSEKIEIVLPRDVYIKLERKAKDRKITVHDLVLRAIVKVLEEG